MKGQLFECSRCGIREKLGPDERWHRKEHIDHICEGRMKSNENIKQKVPSCLSYGGNVVCMTCGLPMCSGYSSHCKCDQPDPTGDTTYISNWIYVPNSFFLTFEEARLLPFKHEKEKAEFVRIVDAYQAENHKVIIYFKTSQKKELGFAVPAAEYNFAEDSLASGNRILSKLHDIPRFSGRHDIYMGHYGNQWFPYQLA